MVETLARIKEDSNPDAYQRFEEGGVDESELRYASWYPEIIDGRQQCSLYSYVVRPEGHALAAFMSETEDDLRLARGAWRSLSFATDERLPSRER